MLKKRECKIKQVVQIICPFCGGLILLPMCKAVNGEVIVCTLCQREFNIGM